MRITAPFSTDGQPRVKLVWNLVPYLKVTKSLLVCFGGDLYCTTIHSDLLLIQRTRRRDVGRGTCLGTRGFFKFFLYDLQGNPGTPETYSSSVEFSLLLLLKPLELSLVEFSSLLSSWYSSMAFSKLSLDDIFEKNSKRNLKDERRRNTWL